MEEEYEDDFETTEGIQDGDPDSEEGELSDSEDETSASDARGRREPPPKNLASERLRRELKESQAKYQQELAELRAKSEESTGVLSALRKALGGRQNGSEETSKAPPDPVDDPEGYNEFVRQTSRSEGTTAAQRAIAENTRRLLTNSGEKEFLGRYPDFEDDSMWAKIGPKAAQMYRNGTGSGEAGAVTADDLEGLAWGTLRAEMQAITAKRTETNTIENWRRAENASGVRGRSGNPRDPKNMSVSEIEAALETLSEAEAANLVDSLPREIQEKLLR